MTVGWAAVPKPLPGAFRQILHEVQEDPLLRTRAEDATTRDGPAPFGSAPNIGAQGFTFDAGRESIVRHIDEHVRHPLGEFGRGRPHNSGSSPMMSIREGLPRLPGRARAASRYKRRHPRLGIVDALRGLPQKPTVPGSPTDAPSREHPVHSSPLRWRGVGRAPARTIGIRRRPRFLALLPRTTSH